MDSAVTVASPGAVVVTRWGAFPAWYLDQFFPAGAITNDHPDAPRLRLIYGRPQNKPEMVKPSVPAYFDPVFPRRWVMVMPAHSPCQVCGILYHEWFTESKLWDLLPRKTKKLRLCVECYRRRATDPTGE